MTKQITNWAAFCGAFGLILVISWSAANPALFKIIDLSLVWVMLEVPQDEISHVHIGAKVSFTTEVAPGKSFKGRVTKLGETFDAASRTASIRTEIENPNFILKPGMLVLADVSTDSSLQQQLTIPELIFSLNNNLQQHAT
jgi:multidrug efflux pump subunit AcrA (membrane-fusion protein)